MSAAASRSPRAAGSGELLLEQLEVGQDARERRAQLVGGVGHELALALERRLGLAPRGVELAQHVLQRVGQLADLVVGHGAWAGAWPGSRVRATSRAARVSPAMGRMARRATANPARNARPVPPSMPSARNRCRRPWWSRGCARLGVLDERHGAVDGAGVEAERCRRGRATRRTAAAPPRAGRRRRARPRRAAPGRRRSADWPITLPFGSTTRIDGAAGGRGPDRFR